ncbi:hypothetical protein [Rosistilla oblonga]|uniref:Uncharacterized protein n=1 Tax=Rosistilla oblonga TaxID=2527990 RepID=A0A518ITP7_9BACT|nr:hypothetical protein [Rosistilla oblonga]QDV56463.1 hypothetical protein Mal33_24530 [Rosistilla oblonga]
MLTEQAVESMFRQLLADSGNAPDAFSRAERLLAQELDENSPLRLRLTAELDATRFREPILFDLDTAAYNHHRASWDAPDADVNQNISVEIHIRDAEPKIDKKKLDAVQNAVSGFLMLFGYSPDPESHGLEAHASWHWYEWFRSRLPFVRKESEQVYGEMKEALRRRHIDQAGADAFNSRAMAAAELIKSIEPFQDVVIRLGDIVIVKKINQLGIETLSPELARRLDQRPEAMQSSATFYQFIEEQKPGAVPAESTPTLTAPAGPNDSNEA